MTTPTPELVTAEQAAAWVSEGPGHGVHINNKTLNALARTIIALHEALDRTMDDVGALRKQLAAAEARHDDDRQELNRFTAELGDERARADAAEARVAVRVKPLVWGARGDSGQWYGKDPTDRFHYTVLPEIQGDLNGPWVCMLNDLWRPYPTLEAAKAAAQADYEARIRAALETGERTPVAWMGREGYFTTDPRQASAHARHGTPLTPLYPRAALETGAGDE